METVFALLALLWGKFIGHRWIPLTKQLNGQQCGLRCSFDAGPHKLLNKQLYDRWFETAGHSCDVIVTGFPDHIPPMETLQEIADSYESHEIISGSLFNNMD